MTFYRKPTHTNRLLDQSLHNLTSLKATTIRILTRWAQLVCDSTRLTAYKMRLTTYTTFLVKRTTMQTLWDKTLIITLDQCQLWPSYDSDYTIHQRHLWNYRTYTTKLQCPCCTQTFMYNHFQRLLTNVKDKDKPEDRQGAVYKIKCCDCQATYMGETDRDLSSWLTEHKNF